MLYKLESITSGTLQTRRTEAQSDLPFTQPYNSVTGVTVYQITERNPSLSKLNASIVLTDNARICYFNLCPVTSENFFFCDIWIRNLVSKLTLILRRSLTRTVWFYTSTNNKRAARPKLYTKSLTRDLKRMYSRFKLVRISIKL